MAHFNPANPSFARQLWSFKADREMCQSGEVSRGEIRYGRGKQKQEGVEFKKRTLISHGPENDQHDSTCNC